jgi:hypothetical protein
MGVLAWLLSSTTGVRAQAAHPIGQSCSGATECGADQYCVQGPQGHAFCTRACDGDCACPSDYHCADAGGTRICLPGAGTCSTAPTSAASSAAPAPTDAEAHALFTAGQLAYQAGRFDSALTQFTRAYELSHRAELLYNIGQCQDFLRHDAEALAAFEAYLAAVPAAPTRAVVEARVVALRAAVAAAAPASPPSTAEAAPVETIEEPAAPAPPPELAHLIAHGPDGYALFRRRDAPGTSTGTDDQLVCALPCEIDLPAATERLVVDRGNGDAERHALDPQRVVVSGRMRLTIEHIDRGDQRTAGGWTLAIGLGVAALFQGIGWGLNTQRNNDGSGWGFIWATPEIIIGSVVTGFVLMFLNDSYDGAVVRF